ncbi:HAD family hydrolase [Blautia schinkii]|nr:HAD family hydrolase [Blautia schinkii]
MIEISDITHAMMYIDDIEVVVFDLDDTLYSEKEYVKSGFRAVSRILPQINDAEEKLWKAFEEKKLVFNEVLQSEGIFKEELKNLCVEEYHCHIPNIHMYDGVVEMLVKIRNQGRKIGIITDGRPEGQRAKIENLNIEKYVDDIIVTDELGGINYRKPCTESFSLMRKRMEKCFVREIPYFKMCYIGDNIKKDFIAPQKLGMRCIWFKNTEGLYF